MKLFLNTLIAALIFSAGTIFAQTAKVQVIHNSALPAAAEVDVYINGAKPDALDNFAFRAATPFVELPAGEDIVVTVAAPNSMDVEDQVIATFNLGQLEADMSYVVIANGILGDGFTSPDTERDINFNLFPIAGKMAADNMNNVALNVFHGVTDAPAVDVYADINGDALISDLDYAESTDYVELPAADYDLTVTAAGNKDVVAGMFDADVSTLGGGAAVVFASGFLSPGDQGTAIPDSYGFGLFAALPDGTVIELPNLMMQETAMVQVIHNSALPAAAEVDVYINGAKPDALDNFAFRAATPFVELPAGEDIVVTVAAPNSMDVEDQVIATFNLGQLEADMSYVVIANGILGDGFTSPDTERDINFNLFPIAGKMAADNMNNVALNVFHGVTDAPAVDVYADINGDALISDLDYVESTDYVELPAASYELTVTAAGNQDVVAGTFEANISTLGGGAAVVFASGFLAPDSQEAAIPDSYGFGLFAALPDGTVIELPETTLTSVNEYGFNSSDIILYPIPATDIVTIKTSELPIKHVLLYDFWGEEITNQNSNGEKNLTLDISGLSSGIYYMEIKSYGGSYLKRFVVH